MSDPDIESAFIEYPLFDHTFVPLNTASCPVYGSTCQAMNAIADSVQTGVTTLGSQSCQLSMNCLAMRCSGGGFTTSLTLSPCDYSVTLRVTAGGIDYEGTFVKSGLDNLRTGELIDVTIARFKDSTNLGLQVYRIYKPLCDCNYLRVGCGI